MTSVTIIKDNQARCVKLNHHNRQCLLAGDHHPSWCLFPKEEQVSFCKPECANNAPGTSCKTCFPITKEETVKTEFVVKDSGKRAEFTSGMVRDTSEGKTRFHRVADGPMLRRWATHLTKGATKYPDVKPGVPNWTLAAGEPEMARFKESAFTHFMQWYYGETDEDHAAAVIFNINGAEYVKEKLHV